MTGPAPPTVADVREAERALAGRVVRTPLVPMPRLSERAGVEVIVKAELFQRGEAFKLRGVLNRVRTLSLEERAPQARMVGRAAAVGALIAGRIEGPGPIVLVVSGGNIAPQALKSLL